MTTKTDTDPVTPKRTLAIGAFLLCEFDCIDKPAGQVRPADTLIAAVEGAEERPGVRSLQSIGDHELCTGLAA